MNPGVAEVGSDIQFRDSARHLPQDPFRQLLFSALLGSYIGGGYILFVYTSRKHVVVKVVMLGAERRGSSPP